MSSIELYDIDGFEFVFMLGWTPAGTCEGIVINPETTDICDPLYLGAYEIAKEEFRLWRSEKLTELEAESRSSLRVTKNQTRKHQGYVYLIQSPTGAYKIGKTKDPNDRMKTFRVKLPFEIEYTCLIPTDDMRALEAELHGIFSKKRIGGEWFQLDEQDISLIKGLAGDES